MRIYLLFFLNDYAADINDHLLERKSKRAEINTQNLFKVLNKAANRAEPLPVYGTHSALFWVGLFICLSSASRLCPLR